MINLKRPNQSTDTPRHSFDLIRYLPLFIIILAFFLLILRRAWLCDDAYITFRTVDNFVHGYKLTWNTIERVQAYTHPLWMLLLSLFYFFTRDIYHTALALSLVISTCSVTLYAFKVAGNRFIAFGGILILSLSNAFVDYSTSGLENPLTHLLLVIFFYIFYTRAPSIRKVFLLSLISSFAGVNRLDSMLLYFPAVLFSIWEIRTIRAFLIAIAGQIPLFLWECFSLFYYGFPFPNTFYAKLNTGISSQDLLQHGLFYFQNSLTHDPLTLLTIFSAILLALISKKKASIAAAAGVGLYLFYILKIGGDFMSGRFFAAPLLCAVIVISQSKPVRFNRALAGTTLALVILIGFRADIPTLLLLPTENTRPITDQHGITNERVWYFPDFALFSPDRNPDLSQTAGKNGAKAREEAGDDLYVIAVNNTGVFGFYAGPSVYVIDQLALSDPLLARLPAIYQSDWRIGHFTRVLPDGYRSAIYKLDTLDDPDLAKYYEKLHLVVSGKLSDPKRLVEIWKLNTGQYDEWIDFDKYRYPEMHKTDAGEVLCPQENSPSAPDLQPCVDLIFDDNGLDIDFANIVRPATFALCLDRNDRYRIEYLMENEILASQTLDETASSAAAFREVTLPAGISGSGFDHLRIFPLQSDEETSLCGIQITPQ